MLTASPSLGAPATWFELVAVYVQTDYGRLMYLGDGKEYSTSRKFSPGGIVHRGFLRSVYGVPFLLDSVGFVIQEWDEEAGEYTTVAGKY